MDTTNPADFVESEAERVKTLAKDNLDRDLEIVLETTNSFLLELYEGNHRIVAELQMKINMHKKHMKAIEDELLARSEKTGQPIKNTLVQTRWSAGRKSHSYNEADIHAALSDDDRKFYFVYTPALNKKLFDAAIKSGKLPADFSKYITETPPNPRWVFEVISQE